MAAKPLTRLRELLNEGQEPFKLESYLLERRCQQRDIPLVSSSEEIVKQSGRTNMKKRALRPPKFLRVFYNKFVALNNLLSINACDATSRTANSSQTEADKRESSEEESSSALEDSTTEETIASSFTTESSDSRRLEEKRFDKKDYMEEAAGRRSSPVSVLEDVFSNPTAWCEDYHSRTCFANRTRISEETILSASMWKLFLCSSGNQEEVRETIRSAPLSFLRSKKIMQQKKQLMFDFVREAMHKQKQKQKCQRENCSNKIIVGFEEIGKFISEETKVWENKSGGWTNNLSKQLGMDLVEDEGKWYEISSEKKDIALEIGDLVLEEMKHEVVRQLISCMTQQRTSAT